MPPRRITTRQPRPQQLLPLLLIIILALSLHNLHISSAQAQDTSSSSYANHIPIRYKVNQKQTECLYERFQKGEQVTFSVFVVEALLNGKPKCDLFYEGPITTHTITNDSNNNNSHDRYSSINNMSLGRMIRQGLLNELAENRRDPNKSLNHRIKVDWTHAGEEEDKLLMRQEIERANDRIQRDKQRHSDPNHKPISTFASPRIEPFEITNRIPADGYYRVCAQAELQALVIEMDARSSSKMGGVDEETGHVYTYAKRDLLNEEAAIDNKNGNNKNGSRLDSNTYQSSIEELSKLLVNQVEDADLRQTRDQIKVLNAKTSDIMTEIQTRMTRIRAHEHGARRNSANMAWSSKVKTLVFAVISGFQVYTMRKWLLSNSLLGR